MTQDPGLIEKLCQAMEEEIFFYHLLGEELKKESEFLRKGSTESLLASIRSLEVHTGEIRKIRESVRRMEQKILALRGKKGEKDFSAVLAALPAPESRRVRDYQKTLERLRKGVAQINARNKTFAQASLDYWKDLFSHLTQPLAESRVYFQNGKAESSAHLPVSLNRKV